MLELLKRHDYIDDFIFFGSFVKSRSRPSDIDLAILSRSKASLGLKEEIRKLIENVDVEMVSDFYSPLWPVLMREGYSVNKGEFLFKLYNLQPVVLYSYSLKRLDSVQKVQFSRGVKSIVKETKGKFITRSVVLVPMDKKFIFEELLATWNIEFDSESFELFPFLRKGF